jgi:hypothetical protein
MSTSAATLIYNMPADTPRYPRQPSLAQYDKIAEDLSALLSQKILIGKLSGKWFIMRDGVPTPANGSFRDLTRAISVGLQVAVVSDVPIR